MKIKKILLASTLAFGLVIGAFVPKSFAETDAAKKELKLEKILNLPEEGVKTPDETFTFKFEKISYEDIYEGKITEDLDNYLPDMEDIKLSYDGTENTDNDPNKPGKQIEKNLDIAGKFMDELDPFLDLKNTFERIYTYKVTETSGNTTDMTYSKAEYEIIFDIDYDYDEDEFYFKNIIIKKLKNDDGNVEEEKVDKLLFNNNYDKKDGNDNPGTETNDDKKGFALKKIVTGDDTDKSFIFSIKVTKPVGSHSDAETFKYKKIDKDGKAGNEQTGKYGENTEVSLGNNERIVFTEVLLGSKVSVSETKDNEFNSSITTHLFNGVEKKENVTDGDDALSISGVIGNINQQNYVEYKNEKKTLTPQTGVFIDNLPFIGLVLVAGLGIFFFVKNRKEEEELYA